jgi:hypothetical protein
MSSGADIVVYLASAERNKKTCIADVTRLLESGKNVVAMGRRATAMHAISSIPAAIAAAPGLIDLADLGA